MHDDIMEDASQEESAAYSAWLFCGEDPDTGVLSEPWIIQERAWLAGYRAGRKWSSSGKGADE